MRVPTITLYRGEEAVIINEGDRAALQEKQAQGYSTKRPKAYIPQPLIVANQTPNWELQKSNDFEKAWDDWRDCHNFLDKQIPPFEVDRQLREMELVGARAAVMRLRSSVQNFYREYLIADPQYRAAHDAACDASLEADIVDADKRMRMGRFDANELYARMNRAQGAQGDLCNAAIDPKIQFCIGKLLEFDQPKYVEAALAVWRGRVDELQQHVDIITPPRMTLPADLLLQIARRVCGLLSMATQKITGDIQAGSPAPISQAEASPPPGIGTRYHKEMLAHLQTLDIGAVVVRGDFERKCAMDDGTKTKWLKAMVQQGFIIPNGQSRRGSAYTVTRKPS